MATALTPSIIKEINDFSNCEVALFTTYGFDISFFDISILPLITSKRARACIFVDANQFVKSIKENYSPYIGNRYYVQPFRMVESFHPKLILLLKKGHAKLIVSSANLTFSGYCTNNELYQAFTYDEKNEQYLNLIIEAFNFFKQLAQESKEDYILEQIEYIQENYLFLGKEVGRALPRLLTSYSVSILRQLANTIGNNVKTIRVAVPFYDEDLTALKVFKKQFNNPDINLYIQNARSTFPKDKYSDELINELIIFDDVNNNEVVQKRFYHGKVFNFVTDDKEYILYGSANFTNSALLRSHLHSSGNLEASILDEGEPGSFDSLFDLFIPNTINADSLKTRPAEDRVDSSEEAASFVKGTVGEDGLIEIIFKSNFEPQRFAIDGVELILVSRIEMSNNQYLIRFSGELSANVFDLEIIGVDQNINVRCFVNNLKSITMYIHSSSKNPYKNIDESDVEKYRKEDFIKHFEAITNDIKLGMLEEKQSKPETSYEINDDTEESATGNEETSEDTNNYDDDFYLPIGSKEIYGKASVYLNYFVEKVERVFTGTIKPKTKTDKKNDEEEKEEREIKPRYTVNKILDYFVNFGSAKNHHFDGLDFEHLFKLYVLFSETFIWDMYIEKERKTNVERLINAKIDFIVNRIMPSLDSQSEHNRHFLHFKKQLALLCLECHGREMNSIHIFKDELIKLDKFFNNTLIEEVFSLMSEVGSVLEIERAPIKINDLKHTFFDLPNEEELKELINRQFNFTSSTISFSFNEQSCLDVCVNDIVKGPYFDGKQNIDTDLVDKIIKFINRYYGDNNGENIAFQITIENYTDYISKIVFKWTRDNYRNYQVAVAWKSTGILGPFRPCNL